MAIKIQFKFQLTLNCEVRVSANPFNRSMHTSTNHISIVLTRFIQFQDWIKGKRNRTTGLNVISKMVVP